MGFRFRKSVKIIPGVRVNVSKSGVSTSLGGRGATVNIGRKGVRTTVGIPGSGLSHSTYTPYGGRKRATPFAKPQPISNLDPQAEEERMSFVAALGIVAVAVILLVMLFS